jgi:integrase
MLRNENLQSHFTTSGKKMDLNYLAELIIPILGLTKKTEYTYRWSYSRHFAPLLGNKEIIEVSRADIEGIIFGLPNQTGYQALMIIKSLFREAHNRKWVTDNPTLGIKAPKIRVKPSRFLTWEQIEHADFGKYESQIKFLALHGLRWGEAVVLTKDDIRDGLVYVNRSIHGDTKTASGVRTVPYLGYFKPLPKTRKPIAKVLTPYDVTIHSLRKSYAYILKSNNVHVTTAQKLLGHASPMVTLSVYTQVLDSEIHETGTRIMSALGLT